MIKNICIEKPNDQVVKLFILMGSEGIRSRPFMSFQAQRHLIGYSGALKYCPNNENDQIVT